MPPRRPNPYLIFRHSALPIALAHFRRKQHSILVIRLNLVLLRGHTLNKRLSKRVEALEQSFEIQRWLILPKEAIITQPAKVLNQARIETFANAMRERLHDKNPQFRKAYLRLFVGNVEVGEDRITISGPKDALMHQVNSPRSKE